MKVEKLFAKAGRLGSPNIRARANYSPLSGKTTQALPRQALARIVAEDLPEVLEDGARLPRAESTENRTRADTHTSRGSAPFLSVIRASGAQVSRRSRCGEGKLLRETAGDKQFTPTY